MRAIVAGAAVAGVVIAGAAVAGVAVAGAACVFKLLSIEISRAESM
jgi:hypothetical protein